MNGLEVGGGWRATGRAVLSGLGDLLFAPVCLSCRALIPPAAPERGICGACWTRMREIPYPRCSRCGTPRRASISARLAPEGCAVCTTLPPGIRSVRSAFVLQGPAHRMVHGLKYAGWHFLAVPMARRMAKLDLGEEAEDEVETVVPVPLSRVRMRQRGYNQAGLLGEAVARYRGLRFAPGLLQRTRATETQTALHPTERLANVAGAFRVADGGVSMVHRKHILLVDDVWTTGATTLACADGLFRAGARAVSVLTFARALPELRR